MKIYCTIAGAVMVLMLAASGYSQTRIAAQNGNLAFDGANDALRVNAVANGGGSPASQWFNLDQLFNLIYDSTNKALKVNIVAGVPCTFASGGGINCTATGANQNVTLQPSGTGSVAVTNGSHTLSLSPGNISMDDSQALWINANHGPIRPQGDVQMFASFAYQYKAMTFSATPTFTVSGGGNACNVFGMTLTANVTAVTISGGNAGEQVTFIWKQDGTGGWTVATPTGFHGFTSPGATASTRSIQTCTYDGTDWTCGVANVNIP